ncbi:MAG: non-hydrolyzing UDP-N-acetylglucosamine 2-epimerase [Nocardioidaceae bacterium]
MSGGNSTPDLLPGHRLTEPAPEYLNGEGAASEAIGDDHPLVSGHAVEPERIGAKLQLPIVVGTRPEAIKLVPLILAMRRSHYYEPIVVSTGQHQRMVQFIFDLAGIRPDVTLWAGSRRSQLNERVTSVMRRFEDFIAERFELADDDSPGPDKVLSGHFPPAVIVHGDTSSAMAAALSAFHLHVPVMHVEAGLRTGGPSNTPFPEELNRQVIGCIAGLHFAPTAANLQNLVRENVPVSQVFVTGNTGIDALQWASKLDVRFANERLNELYDSERRVIVVTAHRRESWGAGLVGIAEGIARLAEAHPEDRFVLPVHPNPRVGDVLRRRLERHDDNVLLVDPLGYATFAKLLGRAHLVITDSGGIQEEAPSLGKPVLVLRDVTERGEGLEAGTLRMVGTDPERIFAEGDRLLCDRGAWEEMATAPNPYGDGRAADRIVAALEHLLVGGEPPAPFGPGYSRTAVAQAAGYELPEDLERAAPREGTGEPNDHLAI